MQMKLDSGQVMSSVERYFDERQIGGDLTRGEISRLITEATQTNVSQIVQGVVGEVQDKIERLANAFEHASPGLVATTARQGPTAALRVQDGVIQRLPLDWRFPNSNALDFWMQWNIGDAGRNVRPLRSLDAKDYKFLDGIPLSAEEMKQRRTSNPNRRDTRRDVSDMKYMASVITKEAEKAGVQVPPGCDEATARSAFQAVEPQLRRLATSIRGREQHRWRTLLNKIRKRESDLAKQQQLRQQQEEDNSSTISSNSNV